MAEHDGEGAARAAGGRPRVGIVGAGAAGLWAAAVAARRGARVVVLEKTRRAGTKILASGGTRCNVTTTLGPQEAARLFGAAGERFLRPAFRALPPEAVRWHLESLGVPTVEAPLDKVFPRSQRARDVRDALLADALEAGAQVRTLAPVEGLAPREGGWALRLAGGEEEHFDRVVLACGGASYPATGTKGEGYRWLAELGLAVVEPVPALVPLISRASWVRELAGIALEDVVARLVDEEGRVLGRRRRPILFTHEGLSGPAAMDLSGRVARRHAEARRRGLSPPRLELVLDLVPDLTREELRARLVAGAQRRGSPRLTRVLGGLAPRRLLLRAAEVAGIAEPARASARLARRERHRLVEAIKGLRVPVDGTLGFERAEVTAGGLALREVSPATMEVTRAPGLFVVGELLDLDGPIGGLSFQVAFATAELAGRAAARAPAAAGGRPSVAGDAAGVESRAGG